MVANGYSKPTQIFCNLHTNTNLEKVVSGTSSAGGFLSRGSYDMMTHIMMAFGTRVNVKYQKNYVGEKYKYFCVQNNLIAMKIAGEYGSRWTCRSRNAVSIFRDLMQEKSSLIEFCQKFKNSNSRLKNIIDYLQDHKNVALCEIGVFAMIWKAFLKPFWVTLSKPRVPLGYVTTLVTQEKFQKFSIYNIMIYYILHIV